MDLNMLCRRVDALLVLGAGTLGQDQIEQLQRSGMPHMVIGLHGEQDDGFEVQAATIAIRHLVQFGHADLALFHGGPETGSRTRMQAGGLEDWTSALNADGIQPRAVRIEHRIWPIRSSRRAFDRLWAEPGSKPTAIICASDEIALGVLLEAARKGITIPEDLSIAGMDGQNLGESLGLTAVIHHPARQAAGGIHRLLDALEGDRSATHPDACSPELVIRQSTAAPREKGRHSLFLPT